MIHIIGSTKPIQAVACSGGVDSMAALSFLRNGKHAVTAVFFHHGTETSEAAQSFVARYCGEQGIPFVAGRINGSKPPGLSPEEWWRNERYAFLHSLNMTIATAHHLNDVAETYLWGMMHGRTRHIHYIKPHEGEHSNVVRPFLLTKKTELVSWCERHDVPWIEDTSNTDVAFTRNRIRHNIMPEVEQVNPGFLKVVERLTRSWLEESADLESV